MAVADTVITWLQYIHVLFPVESRAWGVGISFCEGEFAGSMSYTVGASVNIAQRVAYAETGATGQGVCETTDQKAGAEIAAVWDYVKRILNG